MVLYVGEFGASVAMIVNATVVMFLAILVENSDRSWKDKNPERYQVCVQSQCGASGQHGLSFSGQLFRAHGLSATACGSAARSTACSSVLKVVTYPD